MNAYYEDADTLWTGPVSAMMAHDKGLRAQTGRHAGVAQYVRLPRGEPEAGQRAGDAL
jgi:hypothetical protein